MPAFIRIYTNNNLDLGEYFLILRVSIPAPFDPLITVVDLDIPILQLFVRCPVTSVDILSRVIPTTPILYLLEGTAITLNAPTYQLSPDPTCLPQYSYELQVDGSPTAPLPAFITMTAAVWPALPTLTIVSSDYSFAWTVHTFRIVVTEL